MKIELEYNNGIWKETDSTDCKTNEGVPPLVSVRIYNAIYSTYQEQMKKILDNFPNKSVVSKLEIELKIKDKGD